MIYNAKGFSSMSRKGYLSIKEAAVQYEVSRAKLHRLVSLGRLHSSKDPRDERVTLLRLEELESLFMFPMEEGPDMDYEAQKTETGRLTAELLAEINAFRVRVSRGRKLSDSTEIIREGREQRSRQVFEAAFGRSDEEPDK